MLTLTSPKQLGVVTLEPHRRLYLHNSVRVRIQHGPVIMSSQSPTVTQIIYLIIPPTYELGSENSDVGKQWSAALDLFQQSPGFQRLYWGRRLEEPEKVQLHIGELDPGFQVRGCKIRTFCVPYCFCHLISDCEGEVFKLIDIKDSRQRGKHGRNIPVDLPGRISKYLTIS